jgi:AcrR family transcriptional regulator
VQAAAIGYHYASKMDLFNAVVARRALIINEARSRSLDLALAAEKGRALQIEALVTHYVAPLLEATSHGDPGWRNFASLMGRLANSPRGTEMINQHYSDVAGRYMAKFQRALPAMPAEGRWEAMLGQDAQTHRDSTAILGDLVPFVAGGFKALAGIAPPVKRKVSQST